MADHNSIFCPNCQRATNLLELASSGQLTSDNLISEITECNNCAQQFLVHRTSAGRIVRMWPKALPKPVDPAIPSPIRDDLEEAQICFANEAYRAAAVMARRALQNVCIDKNAPTTKTITTKAGAEKTVKMNLVDQIDWLEAQRIITPNLRSWAHEVRATGNDGAHPASAADDSQVTKQDAEDILELTKAFCLPLYVTTKLYNDRKAAKDSKPA